MKETRLAFTAESILALQAGRKTQTRRLVKPQPDPFLDCLTKMVWSYKHRSIHGTVGELKGFMQQHSPYGQPGDLILATETWRIGAWNTLTESIAIDYKADGFCRREWLPVHGEDRFQRYVEQCYEDCARAGVKPDEGKYHWEPGHSPCRWRSPRYMPKEFSRFRLPLTSTGAERLQDITLAGVFAEGMTNDDWYETAPVDWFSALWDRLHPECSWELNPFVYVLGLGGD